MSIDRHLQRVAAQQERERIIAEIRNKWNQFPTMRFAQLVYNMLGDAAWSDAEALLLIEAYPAQPIFGDPGDEVNGE